MEPQLSEFYDSGFPLVAKLALISSPLYLSLLHYWRWLTLETLTTLERDNRRFEMYDYFYLEIMFSLLSVPVAGVVDALTGIKICLITFLSSACLLVPTVFALGYFVPGHGTKSMITTIRSGTNFIGIGIVGSVIERAFFVSLMDVGSSSFWLYCFLCYYISTVWQFLSIFVIYTPIIVAPGDIGILKWVEPSYQMVTSLVILVTYYVIVRLRRTDLPPAGQSCKVLSCMYVAIVYSLKILWSSISKQRLPYENPFEACEKRFSKNIVTETRKTFHLLVVIICLMYLCGLELILRNMWFYQDDCLSRRPRTPLLLLPMEMFLILFVLFLYPVVNLVVLPLFKNRFHIQLTDLRLIGVALIFHNLSFIATIAVEWTVLSSTADSPNYSNVAIRIYNSMSKPFAWTIGESGLPPVTLFIPAYASRTYLNLDPGYYHFTLNSSVHSMATVLHMSLGKSRNFLLRDGRLENLTSIDDHLQAYIDITQDDTHLFVISGLQNSSKSYLTRKDVEILWTDRKLSHGSRNITSNVTHIHMKEDVYEIKLRIGNDTHNMTQNMQDHGTYSIMFYDEEGMSSGYELDTVRVGFVYSRMWAVVQIILLALGITIGQIPLVRYTYEHAPMSMLATSFSFHRLACAVSTLSVYSVMRAYGTGPGPTTVCTMMMILFTVFFMFLSVSDIMPDGDEQPQPGMTDGQHSDKESVTSTKSGTGLQLGTNQLPEPDEESI